MRELDHVIKNSYLHKFRALAPLLELVARTEHPDILAWFGTREVLRDLRNMLTEQYAWAIPDTRAIETIGRYGRLVEICAGTGYWAWLLRLWHVDIVAYDVEPREGDKSFTNVRQGTEEAVALHPDRNLFLCWPPAGDPVAFRALQLSRGEFCIFVGWKGDDITGDCDFHDLLRKEWELVEKVAIPQWPEMKDALFIYRRRR
jgi:hypothetical protein